MVSVGFTVWVYSDVECRTYSLYGAFVVFKRKIHQARASSGDKLDSLVTIIVCFYFYLIYTFSMLKRKAHKRTSGWVRERATVRMRPYTLQPNTLEEILWQWTQLLYITGEWVQNRAQYLLFLRDTKNIIWKTIFFSLSPSLFLLVLSVLPVHSKGHAFWMSTTI